MLFSKIFKLMLLLSAVTTFVSAQPVNLKQTRVTSPDGQLSVTFYQNGIKGKHAMFYQVTYKEKPIINDSELDIRMDNSLSEKAMAIKLDTREKWCENLEIVRVSTTSKDTVWHPVYGERSSITDRYNAAVVELVKDDNPIYRMNIELRAYNEGVAFRYRLPENPQGTYYNITNENSEFSLPEGTMAWFANWAQAPYRKLPLRDWPGESERPLTLELPGGVYACLAEAQMVDYARTKFKLSNIKKNTLVTSMAGAAALISPVATPWRVVLIADQPAGLSEKNDLLLNLNTPNRISSTDWIKPGKIMRVMSQTTSDAKATIDFAKSRGLQYILFDWKWYGPAFSFQSDATKVAIPDFDLPAIIAYAASKKIGVWLYVNQQALLAQSDSLFNTYRRWGVKGVKFGFVQVGSHRWTTWLEKTIHQAADQQMMVNIHDDWRPTGEQRTWPNLMTAEGIRGNEEMPDATHNTILPFTRFIAGAADYTICYFDKRIKTTHAHQLALAAIYYSPIQTLFWYDKPEQYHGEPELEFWKNIPTSWDDSRMLSGQPGQYVITARRKGQQWFIGAITNTDGRSMELHFGFLPPGKIFKAQVYADKTSSGTAAGVSVKTYKFTSQSVFKFTVQPSGGLAIQLSPENEMQ